MDRSTLYHRHQLSHQQIDDFLGDEGSRDFRETKAQMLDKLVKFQKVTGVLQSAGIPFIPMKGFLLSQRIYQDPTYRITGDFDLFVEPDQVSSSVKALISAGFHPLKYDWPKSAYREKMLLRIMNQYLLFHNELNILVEVHWRLFPNHIICEEMFRHIIWENLIEVPMSGKTYRQFNNEFELLYLVIHGGLHAWRRLKWLVDVHEMLNRFPLDEAKFLDLTRKLKAGRMVALCNAMLKEFFPGSKQMPCAKKVNKFHLRHSRHYILREQDQPGASLYDTWQRARFKLTAFPGLRYKLSAFRFSTFTQREVNENWFPPYPLLVIIDRLWRKTKP